MEWSWDNLDPGLKQWIVMVVSIAASFALPGIGGVLVSCIIDGSFVDMLNAFTTGDWKTLALMVGGVALAGVGAKGALKLLKVAGRDVKIGGRLAKTFAKRVHPFKFENRLWDVSSKTAKRFGEFMKLTESEVAGTRSGLRAIGTALDKYLLHGSMTPLERMTYSTTETGIREAANRFGEWIFGNSPQDIQTLSWRI